MKRHYLLIILMLLVVEKSFSQENSENCIVKNIEPKHLDEECQADEIMEVWCSEKADEKLQLVSQCFTYYKYSDIGNEITDSKVKCNYF